MNHLGIGTCLSGLGPCALSMKLPRCPALCGIAREFVHRSLPVIKSFSLALGTFLFSFPDSFSTTAWPVAAQRKHGGSEITTVAWKCFTPWGFPSAGHWWWHLHLPKSVSELEHFCSLRCCYMLRLVKSKRAQLSRLKPDFRCKMDPVRPMFQPFFLPLLLGGFPQF